MKLNKTLLKTMSVLGIVGGAVHVLQPLGFDLLAEVEKIVAGSSGIVQLVAGVSTIVVISLALKRR